MSREAPSHRIAELAVKFEPFTVSVKAGLPAEAEDGVRLLIVGAGFGGAVMVKVAPFDATPFLLTNTVALP